MAELSGEIKHEIEQFIEEKQKAKDEAQHRRTIRWTAILGVIVGGFFAAVAGAVSLGSKPINKYT